MTSEISSMKTNISELDILKKTVIVHWRLEKKYLLFAKKLIEKVPDLRNVKQHYESFLRKKNRKSIKQSEITTYRPKIFQIPNIVNIKSVITEHPKTVHKLSKNIRKVENVESNSSLYSDTKKVKNF